MADTGWDDLIEITRDRRIGGFHWYAECKDAQNCMSGWARTRAEAIGLAADAQSRMAVARG